MLVFMKNILMLNIEGHGRFSSEYGKSSTPETRLLLLSRSVVPDSVRPHRRQPTRRPVPGILQAGTLEGAATSFSNA